MSDLLLLAVCCHKYLSLCLGEFRYKYVALLSIDYYKFS